MSQSAKQRKAVSRTSRCGCDFASDKHLLNIAAGEAARNAYAGSYDVKLVNDIFGKLEGFSVDEKAFCPF